MLTEQTIEAPRVPAGATPPASSLRGGGSRQARREASPRSLTWQRLGFYAVALMAAFTGLAPLLQRNVWLTTSLFMFAIPLIAIGVAKHVGRRWWQPPVAALVVSVMLLTLAFTPVDSLGGLIPTPETFARWGALMAEGAEGIANQRMPAIATDGIQFLLSLLAIGAAFVGLALDRAPAIAALPLLVVLDIPVVIRAGVAEPVPFVIAALAFLALLRVGRRRMPVRGVLVAAGLVVVGSLVLPSVMPPVRQAPQAQGAGFGTGLNPLINLGQDLRRGDPVTALNYTTTVGGVYLRLATLDDFNGISWRPGDVQTDIDNDVTQFPAPPGLAADVTRTTHTLNVEVEDVTGHWLPVPYPAVSISGLEGEWTYESDGLDVRSPTADARGQRYSVTFLDVDPNYTQLFTGAEPGVPEQYLALPELPSVIATTARQVTSGAQTTYEKALALQTYFTDGSFDYSTETPVEEGYDGTGAQVVAVFLDKKSGYCVHFASAMALMARTLDIPARVVVGFQPGRRVGVVDGLPQFTVSSDDLHAWPELYFDGIGWLRFEPTPGRGALPDYAIPGAIDNPETPENEAEQPSAEPTTAPTTPVDDKPTDVPVDGDEVVAEAGNPLAWLGIVPIVALVLLVLPGAARIVIRSRRLRRVHDGDAEAAWAEIRDTAYDHDWVAPESETPRQLSERLTMVVGSTTVEPMLSGVESAAYDRPGSSSMAVQDVVALRRAIVSAAALRVRVRATLLPPSLLARFGVTPRPTRF